MRKRKRKRRGERKARNKHDRISTRRGATDRERRVRRVRRDREGDAGGGWVYVTVSTHHAAVRASSPLLLPAM
eukprot:1450806-Rhodomonas_salina.2